MRAGDATDGRERWGQKYRCGCFLGFATKRAIPAGCPEHLRARQGGPLPLIAPSERAQLPLPAIPPPPKRRAARPAKKPKKTPA